MGRNSQRTPLPSNISHWKSVSSSRDKEGWSYRGSTPLHMHPSSNIELLVKGLMFSYCGNVSYRAVGQITLWRGV